MKLAESTAGPPNAAEPALRRAVVFDRDPDFPRLVAGWLAEHEIAVEELDPAVEDPVGAVRELDPEIVFVAVETSDTSGYGLCSRLKKAFGQRLPVVMTTATLEQRDLELHAKQKLRADAYLEKSLSSARLVAAVDRLIGLRLDEVALVEPLFDDLLDDDLLGEEAEGDEHIAAIGAELGDLDGFAASRRAVLFDTDPEFHARLADELEAWDITVDRLDPEHPQPVDRVRELDPEIVFVAVEPATQSTGYSLFTRLKRALGNRVPVVMTTADLEQRELDLHAKQKLRAAAYLRKDQPVDEILDVIDRLVGLEEAEEPDEELDETFGATPLAPASPPEEP